MKLTKTTFIREIFQRLGVIKRNSGFSLIELLVAMGIFSIVSVAIVTLFNSFQRGYTSQQVTMDVTQRIRSALTYVAYDIKHAGLDPTASLSANFRVITANASTFTFDFDTPDPARNNAFDGIRNDSATRPERKTFIFQNNKLDQIDNQGLANQKPPIEIISDVDVDNCKFEYIDSNRNIMSVPVTAASLNSIRAVRVVLTVKESAGGSGTVSRTMDTMVLCRNLLYNDERRN